MHAIPRLFIAACVLCSMLWGPAVADPSDDQLVGLWVSETVYPTPHGELIISRKGDRWQAQLGGSQAEFEARDGKVQFAFPKRGGGFRGTVTVHGKAISGFWMQPAGDRPNAGGSGQPFATPLILRLSGGAWRGVVTPLRDSFTLYAKIYRDADGKLVAAVRNPEANFTGGAGLYQVSRKGDAVQLSAGETTYTANLAHGPDRLLLAWPRFGMSFELKRTTPAMAASFFPRPAGDAPYVYRRPEQVADGWRTARAGDIGMDEAVLEKLVRRLIAVDPASRRPPLVHSVLVAHRGRLVLEEYFYGYDRTTPHDTRSAAKTYASAMLGAAMMDGVKLSPQSRITQVMAARGPFAHADPRKDKITLAQLMSHTSGLDCNDYDDASWANEETMQTQNAQPDWWKYTLDAPMAHDPGTRYAYCSANTNLVGGALTLATHSWLPALFDRTIARPLQFGPYYWDLQANGEGYMGGGAFIRPRDLLKLGQAYVDGGVWNGRRIVRADWIKRSTAPHADITPQTTGLSAEEFANGYFPGQDGYAWHLGSFEVDGKPHKDYAASGNGGQLLIVVPDYDLVVAFTAGNYMQGGVWNRFRTEIVPKEIIPAIKP